MGFSYSCALFFFNQISHLSRTTDVMHDAILLCQVTAARVAKALQKFPLQYVCFTLGGRLEASSCYQRYSRTRTGGKKKRREKVGFDSIALGINQQSNTYVPSYTSEFISTHISHQNNATAATMQKRLEERSARETGRHSHACS